MSIATIEHATSFPNMRATQATPATKYVRNLLARTGKFVVPTPVLAAYLGSLLVREQFKRRTVETVQWSLAMFDVHGASGAVAKRHITEISCDVHFYISIRNRGAARIELPLAMAAMRDSLERNYGKQVLITGWLPGFRVGEGDNVLELSGNVCPACQVNPTGYKAGSKSTRTRCLNSEDCGWRSA